MTRSDRDRLRRLIDQAKRERLHRSKGITEADRRMWREADQREAREQGKAA